MECTSSFDVVVANFNNGRFLREMINSVLGQDFDHWTLYITDDCSTDQSRDILDDYKDNPRIVVIHHASNMGATQSFKTGIESGSARYVGVLGADDTLPSNALSRMVKEFDCNQDASLIYTDCLDCDVKMNPIGKRKHASRMDPTLSTFQQVSKVFNFIAFPRNRYKQAGGLDSRLRRAMDHDLTLRLDEVGRIHYLPEILYYYRNHEGGISQGKNGAIANQYSTLAHQAAYKRRVEKPISKSAYRYMMHRYHVRCIELNKSMTNLPMHRHLVWTILYRPHYFFSPRFWTLIAKLLKRFFQNYPKDKSI